MSMERAPTVGRVVEAEQFTLLENPTLLFRNVQTECAEIHQRIHKSAAIVDETQH